MIKRLAFLLVIFVMSVSGFAQISGIKTIPGSYSSIAIAISTLNSQGVGTGGVTFNVAAGYTEMFTSVTSGLITTTTSSASRPIVFQKSGSGPNPVVSSNTGGASMTDYVFCIAGTDYVTFDRIDVSEPSGLAEYGFAIYKESAINGSQHVTIRNCTITLERSNTNTIGIYSANVTAAAPQTQLVVTDVAGSNSNNKYYGNTILSCYNGIKISGYRDPVYPYEFYDQKCEIGVDGANTITDFGGDVFNSYGIYTYHQSGQKIANNIINGNAGGSGVCAAIKIDTVNNANVDIFNNTVSLYYYGTGDFYGIYDVHANNFTDATTMNIYNNTISNCTYESPEYGNCTFIHVRAGASVNNFYNNIVTNNTYGTGSSNAEGTLYGIFYHGSLNMPGTVSYHHNQVTNITRMQSTPGGGATNYMRVFGGGNQAAAYANLVDSNIVASSGECIGFYCLMDPRGHKNIYDNTVTNIFDAYGDLKGIASGNANSTSIFRNMVQNLTSHGLNATVTGLELSSLVVTGYMHCYNNMVGDLNNDNASSLNAIIGIYADPYNTSFLGMYNNTVYINASSTGANFGTTGIFLGTYAKSYELINNVIVNKSLATGTGKTVAIRYSTDQFFNYSITSDRNLIYAGTPGPANMIMYDGINSYPTLAHFQKRVYPAEGQSMSAMPGFINVSVSPMDLHINPATPSIVESAGKVVTTVLVENDIDMDPRFPNSGYPVNNAYPPISPDMGADEFGGIPNDIVPPAITATSFLNTASLNDRTLIATITDPHGVPVSGAGLPRVAWKRNFNGIWNYNSGASIGNDQFSFSFGGGVVLGDTVHYYLLAQDSWITPNTGTFPGIGSSGFTANPPTAATPPSPPLSYKIVVGLCGTIMVGAGQTYPTLTAAIQDVNQRELICPTTLLLTDNSYVNETYPIIINQIGGASVTNTLTIKPAPGKTPLFYTNYQGVDPHYWSMITLNGAQHVIFDGSNGNGTDQNMTFRNNNNFGFTATIGFYNNGTLPAAYVTVKNCNILANSESIMNCQGITTQSIIGKAGFHDLVIHNNKINTVRYAVQIYGSVTNPAYNCQITNNTIGSQDFFKNVTGTAVTLEFCDNILVDGNELMGSIEGRANMGNYCGIYIGRSAFNSKIRKNIIHDFNQIGAEDPSDGASGIIYLNQTVLGMTEITNNSIYNIKSPGRFADLSSANAYGIYILRGANFLIHHNSISLSGNYLTASGEGMSGGIGIYNNVSNVDIKNNIIKNSTQHIGGSGSGKSYAMAIGTGTSQITLDYNDYFVNGTGPHIGNYNGFDQPSLNDWKSATGQDVSTTNIDPLFTSETNLKPTTTAMNHTGIYMTALPSDITGMLRTNPPDAGAYEYSVNPFVTTSAVTNISGFGATLNGSINASFKIVSSYFDYGTTTAYGQSVSGAPATIMGNTAIPVDVTIAGLAQQTTYHFRARGVTSEGITVYGNNLTFTTSAGIPENTTATGTISTDTCINATQVITVGGLSNAFAVTPAGHVTLIAGQKINFLAGTTVQQGGYLNGFIATNGQYCNMSANPLVNANISEVNNDNPVTAVNDNSEMQLRIWPNPAISSVQVSAIGADNKQPVRMTLYNMNGIKILEKEFPGNLTLSADISEIPCGLYVVQVSNGISLVRSKLIKL